MEKDKSCIKRVSPAGVTMGIFSNAIASHKKVNRKGYEYVISLSLALLFLIIHHTLFSIFNASLYIPNIKLFQLRSRGFLVEC